MDNEDGITRVPPVRKRGGRWVQIGDEEYKIPPLNFFDLQELADDIALAQSVRTFPPSKEQMDAVARVVHSAISRNYDITLDEVKRMIDIGNFLEVFPAVLNTSGFTKGAGPPGETIASIGANSTPH